MDYVTRNKIRKWILNNADSSNDREWKYYIFGKSKVPFTLEQIILFFMFDEEKDRYDQIEFHFKYEKEDYICQISFYPEYYISINLAIDKKYNWKEVTFKPDHKPSTSELQIYINNKSVTVKKKEIPLSILKTNFANDPAKEKRMTEIDNISKKIKVFNFLNDDQFKVENDFTTSLPLVFEKSGSKFKSILIFTRKITDYDNVCMLLKNEQHYKENIRKLLLPLLMFDDYILVIPSIHFEYHIYQNIVITIHLYIDMFSIDDYYITVGAYRAELQYICQSSKIINYEELEDMIKRLNLDITAVDKKQWCAHISNYLDTLSWNDFDYERK
jgi:hypothetical protein